MKKGGFHRLEMGIKTPPDRNVLSITCYVISRWVPSRRFRAPFLRYPVKPGREVCSPPAEPSSLKVECRVILHGPRIGQVSLHDLERGKKITLLLPP